jgi:hypothetical protein
MCQMPTLHLHNSSLIWPDHNELCVATLSDIGVVWYFTSSLHSNLVPYFGHTTIHAEVPESGEHEL